MRAQLCRSTTSLLALLGLLYDIKVSFKFIENAPLSIVGSGNLHVRRFPRSKAILLCVEVYKVGSERLAAGSAFILAPLPHNKFSSRNAREVLDWRARDTLLEYFTRGSQL